MKNLSRRQIIIGVAGLFVLCCAGLIVFGLLLPDSDTGEATTVAEAGEGEEMAVVEESIVDETAVPPTETPEPTNTPAPTNTPEPTDTPEPTNTPTRTPTNTPVPTPTNTPEPIVLTGSGDSIVTFEKGSEPALVHITGNASSRHFAVTNYDAAGNSIDLLVNTTDPYDGIRPLDFRNDEYTVEFEISATGDWTIEVLPLGTIERVNVPGEISGSGDYVFALTGAAPSRATINGNSSASYFGVFAYGATVDLLVNTTDPYEGTVRLASDAIIIEVRSEGEWTIMLE